MAQAAQIPLPKAGELALAQGDAALMEDEGDGKHLEPESGERETEEMGEDGAATEHAGSNG